MRTPVFLFLPLFCMLVLAGCSSSDKDEDKGPPKSAEELYNEAVSELEAGNLKTAVKKFEDVEREQPFSEWARRAKLMAAFASYDRGDYAESIAMLESYVRLHPASKDAAYAYYLIALSHYEQIADVGRDQALTEEAKQALLEVIRRFPGSDYAKDARLKLDLVEDHLAGKEMEIGRYYQRKNEHLAAINRFRRVINQYETTNHTAEALHRMVESYLSLGLTEDARRAAAVLGHNFPGSPWYKDSYQLLTGKGLNPEPTEEEKGWLNKIGSSIADVF